MVELDYGLLIDCVWEDQHQSYVKWQALKKNRDDLRRILLEEYCSQITKTSIRG